MSAKITVTRSPELRGRHGSYDVAINSNHVGALARGESLTILQRGSFIAFALLAVSLVVVILEQVRRSHRK